VPVSEISSGANQYTIQASYNATGPEFANAQGTTTLNIHTRVLSTSSLTASANPATAGQPVTFTAQVHPPAGDPTATGTVNFSQTSLTTGASTVLGTDALNGSGVAAYTTSSLAVGANPISAAYNGDGNYVPVNSPYVTEQIQPALVKPSLYVADYGSNAISIFASGAAGRKLLGTITGAATQLSYPEGVVLDSSGNLFVANSSASTITEYAPGAGGNVAPIASIAGSATGLDNPRFITIDSSGKLYVVNALSNSITAYASGAKGNATPVATIAGSATGIDDPIGIARDSSGRIYVTNAGDNAITAYASGANGNVAPVYVLQGTKTGLDGPKGVFFNSAGRLVVANDTGGVNTYNATLAGNQAPVQLLAGSATGLINSEQPLIDSSNNTLLVDSLTQGTLNSWPATATGNSAPTTSIQIGAGSEPTQIALNPLNP
jgi:hypothetical protein